jgi:hypothetical protein
MRWLCAALILFIGGCAKLMGYSDGGPRASTIRSYPDGVEGLRQLAGDLLDAAKQDDRDRVHDLLATTIMSDGDLEALFGPSSKDLAPRYRKLMETLVNRGAVELVAQVYERKLDTVEIVQVDLGAKDASADDRALSKALRTPVPFYSIRFRRAGDQLGLRYDFFFYRNGKWLTGNQLAKYLSAKPQ